ncbi:MAG: PAS domain-containing protein, partial [Chloroflexi bacterium]|nr:PAS domain-containing protein [Chloroflexota bacterium]
MLFHDFFAPNTFYLVWPIVMLCAWFGGPGPGILSAVLSLLLLHYLFLSPNGSFQLTLEFWARAVIMMGATCLAGLASQAWIHMAKALNASRQQTLDILEGITDPFYGLDNGWRFTHVNDAAVQLWGRSREKLMGAHIWQEFPQGRETEAYQVMYRAKREQRPQRFETFSAFLNRWVEVNVYPTARGLSVYFRNIDERKRAEQALRESQHFLERIANASPNAIYIYDMEQQLNIYANEQMFAVLGYPPEQLRERGRALIVESVHPDDRS